jgi:Flp pilus assembly protein protease CpaA
VFTSLTLIGIAIYDMKSHRITNSSIFFLIAITLVSGASWIDFTYLLVSSGVVYLFTWTSRCGFGDSKLLIVLINLIVPEGRVIDYISAVLAISVLLVSIHVIKNRSIHGQIAFAPALCGAVLALSW